MLQVQNRMLYILHRKKLNRKNISFIMNDLINFDIFDSFDLDKNNSEDWDILEEQAYWLFESDVSNITKMDALKSLKIKQEENDKTKKSQYFMDQEKRIQAKRQELIAKGVIKPDPDSSKKLFSITTRYGRSPLHEAIAMRNIFLVEKYLKKGKYIDKIDNNGHTAMEMAYYDNYREALLLFEKYVSSKK